MRAVLKRMFAAGGGAAALRAASASSLRILMYHRFTGEKASLEPRLARQFTHIRQHYNPVSLDDVVASWEGGKPLPRRALAITVDDGYADFARAWPVLKSFGLPATLFVVSGFLNRELWLWPDVVHFCLRQSALARFSVELQGGGVFARNLGTLAEREAADAELDTLLLAQPDDARRIVIAQLPMATGVEIPAEIPSSYAPLPWQDLAAMAAEGLIVGAHSRSHPVLGRISSPETLRQEIEGSKRDIENNLHTSVRHFCYPNGQAPDFNAETVAAVRDAGFLSASTAQRGLNVPGGGHWELRRIGADPGMPEDAFALELAGFRMK